MTFSVRQTKMTKCDNYFGKEAVYNFLEFY